MKEGRDNKGQFTEGNQCAAGNKGAYIPIKQLIDTFERLSQEKFDKSFIEFVCDKAFTDNKLLTALLKMMVEKQVEVILNYDGGYADMTPLEIAKEMTKSTTGDVPSV